MRFVVNEEIHSSAIRNWGPQMVHIIPVLFRWDSIFVLTKYIYLHLIATLLDQNNIVFIYIKIYLRLILSCMSQIYSATFKVLDPEGIICFHAFLFLLFPIFISFCPVQIFQNFF